MENRNGLALGTRVTPADGTSERSASVAMLQEVATPHVAQYTRRRRSAIDRRTTRHAGYDVSQRERKVIEEIFRRLKTIGLMRKTRHPGKRKVGWMFTFSVAVYNLVRIRNLLTAPP